MSDSKNISDSNIENSPFYDADADFITKAAGEEILSRLTWMTIQPKVILDIGCGIGIFSTKLKQLYPQAQIIAIDISADKLEYAKNQNTKLNYLHADTTVLPLRHQSVDLIFANFVLPWCANQKTILKEWQRVLRSEGLLMFTALGPDTLKEWREKNNTEIIPVCIDMHEIGDDLLQQGFADPVLDVDYVTVNYNDEQRLITDMQMSEMLIKQIEAKKIPLEITFEIIYAHAFGPTARKTSTGEVRVPLSMLRRR